MSSSSDSNDSTTADTDDDDDEDERYSLRVRLLSAVDLPPSLSPNVPLCPWFELGLADGGGGEEEDHDDDGQHDGGGGKRELHPKWQEETEDNDGDDSPRGGEDQRQKKAGGNESEASKLLRKLPSSSIRTSAFKIMTKVCCRAINRSLLIGFLLGLIFCRLRQVSSILAVLALVNLDACTHVQFHWMYLSPNDLLNVLL